MARPSIGVEGLADERVVRLTSAANRTIEPGAHAARKVIVEAEFTNAAMTFTMPKATGSGHEYEFIVNAALTQDLVVAALGTDVFAGVARLGAVSGSAALILGVYVTSATSDKYTFNNTTSGGGTLGDKIKLVDIASGTWWVEVDAVVASTDGAGATGFAASA